LIELSKDIWNYRRALPSLGLLEKDTRSRNMMGERKMFRAHNIFCFESFTEGTQYIITRHDLTALLDKSTLCRFAS